MSFNRCKCGDFVWSESRLPHRCPPTWDVWQDYGDAGDADNSTLVYAWDSESAAEKWAEWDDSNSVEYIIVGGEDATVRVRRTGSEDVQKFIVSGESVPEYSATEQKEDS